MTKNFQVGDLVWVRAYNVWHAGDPGPEDYLFLGEVVRVFPYTIYVEIEREHGKKCYALPTHLLAAMQKVKE